MRIDCSSLSYLWLSCLYSSYTIILFFIIQYSTWFFLYSTELVFIVLTVYLFLSYDDSIVDSLILIQVYLMYYTWLISFYPLIFNLSIKKHQLSYYVSNSLYLVITLLKYSFFILFLVSTSVSLLFLLLTYTSKYDSFFIYSIFSIFSIYLYCYISKTRSFLIVYKRYQSMDIYKENSIYNNIICTNVCAVGCGAWCWSVVQVVEIIPDNDS